MFGICFQHSSQPVRLDQWSYLVSGFPEISKTWKYDSDNPDLNPTKSKLINTADELPKTPTLVVFSPQDGYEIKAEQLLYTFKHPKHAIYFFGPDNKHLTTDQLGNRTDYKSVYIPMPKNEVFYSFQAAAMILYDRSMKQWQS